MTYDCNFKCNYCDIKKQKKGIEKDVILNSFKFIEKNNIEIESIKFFWWEPLLEKEKIKYLLSNFPLINKKKIYITTNASLITKDFIKFL